MKAKFTVILSVIFTLLLLNLAIADVPQLLNYQGKLVKSDGTPESGTLALTFSIYADSIGITAPLWAETQTVRITDGVFNVLLGSVVPFPGSLFVFNDAGDRYLGIKVGGDTEMTPRLRLTSVAYAFRAGNANSIVDNSITTEKIVDNAVTADKIAPNIVSSINGVKNDGGDIDLVAGAGIAITPSISANQITISSSGFTQITGANGTSNVSVNSTGNVEVLGVRIADSGVFNVSLAAHLVIEISGDGSGRYEFTIRRDNINGTQVGRGWWRPGSAGNFQAVTIAFTGIDTNVRGPVTYYLVARKFDGEAKDALIFIYGLNATYTRQ